MAGQLSMVVMSDGCKINAKILGDAPNKPLMIAHHGAPGLSSYAESEASYGIFADIFRVLVFDMRGCGDSDKQEPFTHKQWIQDVDELRQWAKADKFVMIGASHGGMITLEYAIAHPHHVHGILVGDTTAQFAHWCVLNSMKEALTNPTVKPDPEQLLRILTGRSKNQEDLVTAFASLAPLYTLPQHIAAQTETDVGEVMAKAIKPQYETHNAAYSTEMSKYDVREQLPFVQIPAFVWVGRFDWITPVCVNEDIAKRLGNLKRFVIYEKSGHMAALEEKTKFNEDTRDFLKGLNCSDISQVSSV